MRDSASSGLPALWFLARRTATNFLWSRLAQLKRPRYAISAIAALLYLGFWWAQALLLRGPRGGRLLESESSMAANLLFVAIFVMGAAFSWVWPGRGAPLRFSETEIQWLFSSPFPRSLLVLYKIATRVPALFMSAFFFALWRLITGGGVGGWARALVGFFVVFFTLDLHSRGAGLMRLRARELGLRSGWFSLLAVIAIGVLVAAVLQPLQPVTAGAPLPGDFGSAMERVRGGPVSFLLRPVEWLAGPLTATDGVTFLRALPGALAILLLHVGWVLSIRVSFEESAVDYWLSQARREPSSEAGGGPAGTAGEVANSPGRTGQQPPPQPFRLSPNAGVEIAFAWKNLIAAGRIFRVRTLLVVAGALVLIAGLARGSTTYVRHFESSHGTAGMIGVVAAALLLLTGASMFRNDLRLDLSKLDILRALPVSGPRLVLGEILAPLIILVALVWLLLALAASSPPAIAMPRGLLLALAIVTPGLFALGLTVQNGAAVLFPAWVPSGPEAERGFGALGQRMMASLGRLLVLMIAFAPVSGISVGVWSAARVLGLPAPAALAAAAALSVLLVESALGIWFIGRKFEELEPDEDLPVR